MYSDLHAWDGSRTKSLKYNVRMTYFNHFFYIIILSPLKFGRIKQKFPYGSYFITSHRIRGRQRGERAAGNFPPHQRACGVNRIHPGRNWRWLDADRDGPASAGPDGLSRSVRINRCRSKFPSSDNICILIIFHVQLTRLFAISTPFLLLSIIIFKIKLN